MSATDAVGQPLSVGDEVAYVSRWGSTISIERRTITELDYRKRYSYDDHERWMARTSEGRQWIERYNLVRIKP